MNAPPQDDDHTEAAVWQAMVLFSTLSTATSVWQAARERRAGRDPSAQEAKAFVQIFLRRAAGELQGQLMQLQASLIQAEHIDEEGYIAALVRRYHDLMALRRVTNHLKTIHQRLLSLYPDVNEALVEEARLLRDEGSTLLGDDADAYVARLRLFIHRALVFTNHLHQAV